MMKDERTIAELLEADDWDEINRRAEENKRKFNEKYISGMEKRTRLLNRGRGF
jgi:hypothetical protein